jgi:hypothetical protein
MFWIEDDFHADVLRDGFATFDSALEELRRMAAMPFGEAPNCPPCTNWNDCVREYHIVEYGNSEKPFDQLINCKVVEVSATGTTWSLPD